MRIPKMRGSNVYGVTNPTSGPTPASDQPYLEQALMFGLVFWIIAGMAMTFPARAAWDIAPSFTTMAIYSDNVTLEPKGAEEEDYVLGLRPAITAQSNAAAVDANLSWSVDALFYKNDESRNRVSQSLQGSAATTLVQDLLFVTGTVAVRRQLLDVQDALGTADTSASNAFGEVRTYRLSPYIAHSLSGFARVKAGVNYELVDVQRRYRDTKVRSYFVDTSSGPWFTHFTWNIAANDNAIWYESNSIAETHSAVLLTVRDQFLPNWALKGTAGYEQNEYDNSLSTVAAPDGETWTVGILWTPSPQVDLEAGGGEQIFGHSNFARLGYRERLYQISASYSESLTSLHELQIEYSGKTAINPITHERENEVLYITDSRSFFVREQTDLAMSVSGIKMGGSLRLFQDRYRLQQSVGTEMVGGAAVSARWTPSLRSVLYLRYGIQLIDFVDGRTDTFRTTEFNVSHTSSRRLETSLNLKRHERNTSSLTSFGYVNHVVMLSATLHF